MNIEKIPIQVYTNTAKLQFSGHLESAFRTDYSRKFNTYLRVMISLSTIAYLFSGIVDALLLNEQAERVLEVRYWIGAPLLCVINVYIFTANFWRFQQPVLIGYSVVYAWILVLMAVTAPNAMSHVYLIGVLLTQIAAFVVFRIRFKFALLGTGLITLAGCWVHLQYPYPFRVVLVHAYAYIGVTVITLLATYLSERSLRKNFMYKKLLQHEQNQLQEVNHNLTHVVTSDSLTGIANRRHFDDTIVEEWRRAQRGQYPLSLLMIDVDHFTSFNKHYGHKRGDEALKHVGKLLSSSSKRAGDMVARYSGTSFSIISASCPYKDAIAMSEKICKIVANTRIPHENSPTEKFITVSIGVATITPLMEQQVQTIIQDAEKNLLQAKANGRNGVFSEQSKLTRLD